MATQPSNHDTLRGISVQLYSLREESQTNFSAVLESVAAQGYDGVEPFSLFGKTPREFVREVEGLDLQISSSHFPWAQRAEVNELTDTLAEFGLRRALGGYMPEDLNTEEALKTTIDKTNALVDALGHEGMTLALHNHWWEFMPVPGSVNPQLIYHRLQAGCPDVEFELDTYWAANFGALDPVAELRRIASRAPLLHIKDGPLEKGEPMVALGEGKQPIADIINAADSETLEWLIVELDDCATDMTTAIAKSQKYLADLLWN